MAAWHPWRRSRPPQPTPWPAAGPSAPPLAPCAGPDGYALLVPAEPGPAAGSSQRSPTRQFAAPPPQQLPAPTPRVAAPEQLRLEGLAEAPLAASLEAEDALQPARFCRRHWVTLAASLVVAMALVTIALMIAWRGTPVVQELDHQQSLWIESAQFQRIASGRCAELGWLPIQTRGVCEAAARHLGLPSTHAFVTHLPNKPEGCYYFNSSVDGTETLWLSTNPRNRGEGAMALEDGSREPLCRAQTTPRPPTTSRAVSTSTARAEGLLASALDSFAGYLQLSTGRCTGRWRPIHDKATCQAAAGYLGLEDSTAEVSTTVGRPEGCYYFRSSTGGSATLWLGTNAVNTGVGARQSVDGIRQQLCIHIEGNGTEANATTAPGTALEGAVEVPAPAGPEAAASTTGSAAVPPLAPWGAERRRPEERVVARYRRISNGTCAERGWLPIHSVFTCEAAAAYLALADISASVTTKLGMPEGCYALTRPKTRAVTLWVAKNESNVGEGAQANALATREPICSVPLAQGSKRRGGFASRTATAHSQTTTASPALRGSSSGPVHSLATMTWQGCFVEKNSTGGVLKLASTSTNCAWACREYKVIALKAGRCICGNDIPAPPEYRKVADSLCGAICPHEKELTPKRYCGGKFAHAVYRIDADILPLSEANAGKEQA